ncbi:MAG: transposase [Candidatus Aenigmatarchaeota archaeon]
MKQLVSQLKKFVIKALNKAKQALQDYSHRNSPKKFTQPQHAVILMLKKKFKATYRDVVDYINEMPDVQKAMGLTTIPHYTTIQKFFQRIGELNLLSLIELYDCKAISVDSTGFPTYSSSYYDKIAKKSKKKRYQKMSIAIDCNKQLILNVIPSAGYKHDSKFFIPLTEPLNAEYFIAKALIDIKDNVKTGIRAKLKRSNKRFSRMYHKRSLVESVISVIKRKFGDAVFYRCYSLLRKEILLNVVCYNVYREINQLIISFLQG